MRTSQDAASAAPKQQAESVDAKPLPDLYDAGQPDECQHGTDHGRTRQVDPADKPYPGDDQDGGEVLEQYGDADGEAGDGGVVQGLHRRKTDGAVRDHERPTGPWHHERVRVDRRRQCEKHYGRATEPDPDRLQRTHARVDESLGQWAGEPETNRRNNGEDQAGSPCRGHTATLSHRHHHIRFDGVDSSGVSWALAEDP